MAYRIVYDITTEPPFSVEWACLSGAVVLLGIGWTIVQRRRDRKRTDPPAGRRTGWSTPKVLIVFGTLMAVIGVGLMGWDHWRLIKALERGEGRTVEGPVQSWSTERQRTARTDRREYHTYESFYIGDSIWFGYRWEVGQAGFHNAQDPRIAFSNGLLARATYLYADGADQPPRIVRLELAE